MTVTDPVLLKGATGNPGPALTNRGRRYLRVDATPHKGYTTPNASPVQITGEMEVRFQVVPDLWASGAQQVVASKWGGSGTRSWYAGIGVSGHAVFDYSTNGADINTVFSSVSLGTAIPTTADSGLPAFVRLHVLPDDGSGHPSIATYWSNEESPVLADWTILDTVTGSGPAGPWFNSAAKVYIGDVQAGGLAFSGRVYQVQLASGTALGTLKAWFDARGAADPPATFTSLAGEIWTPDATSELLPDEVTDWDGRNASFSYGRLKDVPGVGVLSSYPRDLMATDGVQFDMSNRLSNLLQISAGSNICTVPGTTFTASYVGKGIIIEQVGALLNVGAQSMAGTITSVGLDGPETFRVDFNAVTASTGADWHFYTLGNDNASKIMAGLAAMGGGNGIGRATIGASTQWITIEKPIILQDKQVLTGLGGHGTSVIVAGKDFPRCKVAGGGFTTPVSDNTTFVITVDAVPTAMQLPNADIPGGVGVGVCGGIMFTYTGTTATTLTGAKCDFVSTAIAAGTDLSTFMVWHMEPATAGGGFSVGTEYFTVETCGLPAIAGVLMPHAQQFSGCKNMEVRHASNFHYRLARGGHSLGVAPLYWWCENIDIIGSGCCDPNTIGFDGWIVSGNRGCFHGLRNVQASWDQQTVIGGNTVAPSSYAAIRLNGASEGRVGAIGIQQWGSGMGGLVLGDKLATGPLTVTGVRQGAFAGLNYLVRIGNVAGNIVRVEDMDSLEAGAAAVPLVRDDLNGNITPVAETRLSLYRIDANGKVQTDSNNAEFGVLQTHGMDPSTNNLKVWSGSRFVEATNTLTLGTVALVRMIGRPNKVTLSKIWLPFSADTLVSPVNSYAGFYIVSGSNLVLIGTTADISGSLAASILSPSVTVQAGQSLAQAANVPIYAACLVNASSGTITGRLFSNAAQAANMGLVAGTDQLICATDNTGNTNTGRTSLPTTIAISALTATSALAFGMAGS